MLLPHAMGRAGRAQRARRKERNVMSKPVYITADSTCDLTPALLERFHVKTIPLHIVLGEENYLDGVDFTQEMIYERYAKDKVLPRTAAVSPQEFTDFFTPLVEASRLRILRKRFILTQSWNRLPGMEKSHKSCSSAVP